MRFQVVYSCAWPVAVSRGEEDLYKASRKENISCCQEIDNVLFGASLAKDGIDPATPEYMNRAAKHLLLQFGIRRCAYVVATTLCSNRWSSDISMKNIRWAEAVCAPFDEDDAGTDRNGAFILSVKHQDCARLNAFADLLRPIEEAGRLAALPVYRDPWDTACKLGEEEQYRDSKKLNIACKEYIEKAISDCYGVENPWCLDTDTATRLVADIFGLDRVLYVLANTIQSKDWDGRISRRNKDWAKTITIGQREDRFSDHCRFVVDKVNPGLTDLFTTAARELDHKLRYDPEFN